LSDKDILRWAAKRSEEKPFLLGYDLHAYRAFHKTSDKELASFLNCSLDALVRLALCRRPNTMRPSFHNDVKKIALHCGADPQRLATLLREVDSLRTFKLVASSNVAYPQAGLLAAARDRQPKSRQRTRRRKNSGK
jgi:hypothetical protein